MTPRPLFACLAASILALSLPLAALAQTAAPPSQKKDTKQLAKPKDDPQPAQSATGTGAAPSLIVQYGDWGVYVSQAAKTKICYALSQPKERQPGGLKRDPGYFFISTRPGENVRYFTVRSTSQRGNPTSDRYSLSGIGQALDRIAQECK